MENWKDVKGYEGLYQISDFGNVRRSGKNLKLVTIGRGYKRVSLCINNFKENVLVHRMVLHHFVPNPDQKPCCNHKDKNPSNNHVGNLEWATYSENERHSRANGKVVWNKGKKMTSAYCEQCRKNNVGKTRSLETRRNMSISQKKRIAQLKEQNGEK